MPGATFPLSHPLRP
ncbi:hypothetical protein E2C01_057687 [Portunus trituberculatus]|uniref:Uncharacterized protein n=1 Tax=Portunus trituberculatus TaxID=210409 RepID=A0A5B7H3B2_PORTR|nr:hypothetical protein [Portunus trituberculatus]